MFYTAKGSSRGRKKLIVTTADDVWLVAEMQVIFYSDKTAKPGAFSPLTTNMTRAA